MPAYPYAPPPPPPPVSGGHAGYGHPSAPYPSHSTGRGGGGSSNSRGRGGHHSNNRGEFHAPPQPQYEYAGQPYQSHNAAPYAGSHPPAGNYAPHQPQWSPEHSHHTLPHHAHAHAPAPISSSNYHPNYAPQPYQQGQYPPQPAYGPPQQFGHPYQGPPPPNQPQWAGQGPPPQATYGGGRGRGGYSERGGAKPHHLDAPVRHGYDHEPVPPPLNASYGHQPYPQDPRAQHYPPHPQYTYAAPPPPPPVSSRRDAYYDHPPRRGRGGGHREGNTRGRGGHHGADKPRNHKPNHNVTEVKPKAPAVGKKKKRKMNTLGLTPGMESESEDDEGEEKVLTDLIGTETLNVSDVAAFLEERKKNFPTKARVEAKKAAELAHKSEGKASSLEKQADKLRRQLRKVESSIKRKREQGDEGDEMRDPSDESSEDEKPESMSTRSHVAPPPPPPARKADVSRHCKYYSTGGTCGKKGKCRFVHDPEVREAAMKDREANNGRLTIQQRLILNDKEQEDLTILQSIQYLRGKGAMTSADVAEGQEDDAEKKDKGVVPHAKTSLLPAASASLPPPPIKREPGIPRRNPPPSILPGADSISAQGVKHYQGWLLEPYGSTNGKKPKSDDLP